MFGCLGVYVFMFGVIGNVYMPNVIIVVQKFKTRLYIEVSLKNDLSTCSQEPVAQRHSCYI